MMIDDKLCFGTVLQVPDIDSNNSWIQIIWGLDGTRLEDESYIIEYVGFFENSYNYIRSNRKVSIIYDIWKT